MPYELLGAAGLTAEARTTYARALIMRARPMFVHAGHGKKASIPRNGGNNLQWRRLEARVGITTALTEGTPGAITQITFISVTGTLDQYGQYTPISDVAMLQSIDDVVAEATEMYGETMGDTIDLVARAAMTGGTTIQYRGTRGSRGDLRSGDVINYAEAREVVDTLRRNNAKPFGDGLFLGIMHPDTERDMFADADILLAFQHALGGGQQQLIKGRVGDFYGVRWLVSSNGRIFASAGLSGADVYATLVFGQEWYGELDYAAKDPLSIAEVIVKPIGSAGTDDPLNQRATIGWKTAFSAVILDQAFGVRLEHLTTRSTAA